MGWNDFLQDNGAVFENDTVVNFGNTRLESEAVLDKNIIADLSHMTPIEVTGKDAETFLHGQFTGDIKSLKTDNYLLSCWCNARGQVIINFYILRINDGFLLLAPRELCEKFIQRLKMFVLRADVAITKKDTDLISIGVTMNDKDNFITHAGNIKLHHPLVNTENYICLRIDKNHPRIILTGNTVSISDIWQQLSRNMIPVGTNLWQMLEILAGLPWLNEQCTEKYLPQYLNLDILNGVSFDKGCFPGQEVIARLRYRGEIKHRLYLASIRQETAPCAGDDLYLDDGSRSAGKIINVQPHPDLGYVFLAVADISCAGTGNIILETTGNVPTFHNLPYLIDDRL